ncbi:MAG: N-acetylmuramoyl-L-alanine amidase [Desulfarculus sp.]|nr:N-acetylmuramoyl-L-alanine amidase [Desulfarculus sp.]
MLTSRPRQAWPLLALLFWLAAVLAPGLAAAQEEGAILDRVRADYQRLTQNPRMTHVYSNWQMLYERSARVYTSDPQGEHGARALWWMGRLRAGAFEHFSRRSDFSEAQDLLRRFTNHFPRSNLADEAQFSLGRLHEKAGDKKQAYLEYLKVTVNHPRSDKVPQAKARLDALERELKGKVGPRPVEAPRSTAQASPGPGADPGLALVTDLRHWSTPTYARLVLSLERPVSYATSTPPRPAQAGGPSFLQIDLKGARLRGPLDDREREPKALMNLAQASQAGADSVRVMVELKQLGTYKVFTLDNPFRLIVDCFGGQAPAPAKPAVAPEPAPEPEPARPPAAKAEPRPVPPAPGAKKPPATAHARKVPRGQAQQQPSQLGLAAQLGLCVNRVVIDPGHGGKDPGATWRGQSEKDIVLDIAKRVKEKLTRLTGCEALLTRGKDVFVPLEDRTAFANTHDADLFVSIHINASSSPNLSGIETYFLNLASDEQSMRVAARENATTQRSISDLQAILNDLMLNTKINESNHLARTLHKNLLGQVRRQYPAQDLKVKQAPFYVLIGARMPAALIEVGFLTNPQEHQRLSSAPYRDQLAEGIAQGIAAYSKELKTASR